MLVSTSSMSTQMLDCKSSLSIATLQAADVMHLQVNMSPDSYLFRMNDVSRELYIVAGGVVELLIEQDDQLDFIESTRSAGQGCSCLAWC